MADDWKFDAEKGREAGLASAAARQRKATLSPQERAAEAIAKKTDGLVRDLLDAALGKNDFEGLKPELRLAAIKTALEYGIGKPTTRSAPADGDTAPPTPEDLFGREQA